MNPEIKKRWLKALRSGDYKQGRRCLRTKDRFCCLGVLCDLYAKETGKKWESGGRMFGNQETVPIEVQEWSGLKDDNPWLTPSLKVEDDEGVTFCHSLAELNDSGQSFKQIASVISKQVK